MHSAAPKNVSVLSSPSAALRWRAVVFPLLNEHKSALLDVWDTLMLTAMELCPHRSGAGVRDSGAFWAPCWCSREPKCELQKLPGAIEPCIAILCYLPLWMFVLGEQDFHLSCWMVQIIAAHPYTSSDLQLLLTKRGEFVSDIYIFFKTKNAVPLGIKLFVSLLLLWQTFSNRKKMSRLSAGIKTCNACPCIYHFERWNR